jgi:hypothetical protein
LDGKIHGLGPRGYGPRQPGPPWIGGHCREPELIGAWPPAPQVVEVAGRGAHSKVPGSPGLGRRRSGDATTVKALVEERLARACSGHRERGRRGGGGVVRRGGAGVPFYRVEWGAGRRGVGEEQAAAVVAEWRHDSSRFGLA